MIEFLSLSDKAFGLEITDISVRVLRLSRKRGKPVVVSASCVPVAEGVMKEGQVVDEERLAAAVREAMAKVVGEKIKTRRVIIALPDNKAFLQVIKMPNLNSNDLRAAVIFEAENYIPLPLEKVYLDFEKVEAADAAAEANNCEVLIAAFPRDAIDPILRAVSKAGLLPVVLEPESQAVLRVLSSRHPMESPSVIVEIGDTKTDLIFYSDNSIRYTFSIPISNRYFLETIAVNANVDLEMAMILKSKYGIDDFSGPLKNIDAAGTEEGKDAAGDRRKIFEALIPGLVDFVQQMKKCIQYYQTHDNSRNTAKGAVGKILLCGSGSDLKGLDEFVSLKLNVPVERVEPPLEVKLLDRKLKNVIAQDNPCAFSVVMGLAMRSLAQEENAPKKTVKPAPAKTKNVRAKRAPSKS
ncbi:MAG: type IV pilus assembly protein PilM [Candidatus Pacebacteria bacterium]|jgi:type IV pilus assembly protein PilM|nr:type IV pilus assembly protein PilM [Candidatus Paceibacterota bacterium]